MDANKIFTPSPRHKPINLPHSAMARPVQPQKIAHRMPRGKPWLDAGTAATKPAKIEHAEANAHKMRTTNCAVLLPCATYIFHCSRARLGHKSITTTGGPSASKYAPKLPAKQVHAPVITTHGNIT